MPRSRSARLVLPGLLGPVADADAVASLAPRLPALERILARARIRGDGAAGGEGSVCAAFAIDGPPWPVAALSRLGEDDGAAAGDDGWWLRVDPVHLRVDTDHARLFGPQVLALTAAEAGALVARLNDQLGDDPAIEAPAPGRWYLRLGHAPALDTWPLPVVAGRNVNPFLPAGADAPSWRGWLTEIQMLLHDAPVNAEREAAGRLPANSVWPWGGGARPRTATAPARVIAADPLTRGLARLAGAAAVADADGAALREGPAGTTLVADFGAREPLVHGEIDAWLEAVARLEHTWLAPALAALRAGRLQRLELEAGDGRRFTLARRDLLRLWRRDRGWHRWLAAEAPWR